MTDYPKHYLYEVLIRGGSDGSLKGASQTRMTVFAEGVERPEPPEPLDLAAVGKLLGGAFPGLANDLAAARARIDELEAEAAALKAVAAAAPAPAPSAGSVTAFQAREALRDLKGEDGGTLLDAVISYVEAHRADNPRLATAWDWVDPWERGSGFVAAFAKRFGLDDAAIDALFRAAAAIEA
jgi:hypothetical protein